MTTSSVDWSTLTRDPGAAAAVAALDALAAGLDTDVPAVLIPVRVETRFATVQVPDTADHLGDLLDALARIDGIVRGLAARDYSTTLVGTVAQKKEFKESTEQRLYQAIDDGLTALDAGLAALRTALEPAITSGTEQQQARLTTAVAALRKGLVAAGAAIARLRSDYQRAQYTADFADRAATVTTMIDRIAKRVQPALGFSGALGLRTGAQAARELGRDAAGRPLRPGLTAARGIAGAASRPTGRPTRRIVIADGTPATALDATRVRGVDREQLVESAVAAERVLAGLSDPTAALGAGLQADAAAITLLPGDLKAELLERLAVAANRPGAAEIRAEIEATPSDRADLDTLVPGHVAGTVFELPGPTRTAHQLLVRIYPEPLAVDTHEEELTDTERDEGAAFWSETAAAGGDEELRKGAWRALCIGRSTRRAAWIARVTEPVDPAESGPTPGAVAADRIAGAITVLERRLAALVDAPTGRRDPSVRRELPIARPAARTLTARQLAAVEKALASLQRPVEAAEALPSAAGAALVARLRAQAAAIDSLATVFGNVPATWATSLAALVRRVGRIDVEPPPAPSTPEVGRREGTWTRAASSTVLPTRLAVVLVADGKAGTMTAGRPIRATLELGLDPNVAGFDLNEDGGLDVPAGIRWMTDFDKAVEEGMALRVPITAQEAQRGFDELFVVGLSDGDAAVGEDRLTAMLDAHHYTAQGLSLLPIGTPTNNTEDDQAGHSTTDDPDLAYPLERGPSLVAAPGSDGGRLAEALGVDAEVLAHVDGADGTDANDAVLANRVLYPGTVGHALEELLPGLVSRDARDRLRAYALGNVAGRGLLPAIRVDDQPYGMLPAVALSLFEADPRDAGLGAAAAAERARQQRFDDGLVALLRRMHEDWSAIRVGADGGPAVKHAHSPEIGTPGFDAQQHFLSMLGLEASSVGASYRFALNVADRGGVRGAPDLGLGFGVPSSDGSSTTAQELGPFALMEHLEDALRIAFGLPADKPREDGLASEPWKPVLEMIETSRAYGLRLLTGLRPLQGAVSVPASASGLGTGTWITNLLGMSLPDLRARTESDLSNVGLAEMLVRHALLAEARRAAAEILVARGVLSETALAALGSSSIYQTWSAGTLTQASSWGLLFTPVSTLAALGDPTAAVPADLGSRTMAEVVAAPRPPVMTEHRTAVTAFAALAPERMTQVAREHLDLCSHRLDAWVGGLAQRRLGHLRAGRPRGAQVGTYGWVENVRPAAGARAATGVPAALQGLPGRPLTADPSAEGFIQTPSPSHAVTAAILRAAYRSQANEGAFGNEMSVNLSSDRVRVALSLIDGVRAGNDLGALLGYRLERFLHEYYARPDTPHGVELDAAIFPLRRAYPTVAAVDGSADAAPEPTRYVVDGLALVRSVLDWIEVNEPEAEGTLFATLWARRSGYPWFIRGDALPDLADTDKLEGVLRGIDAIADALDALGDLTTAETVHQLVRGNHARAAAVLSALSGGTAIPRPEVADTPRTGLPVSHRLVLQLPAVPAEPATPPAGWEEVPVTPRAALEPAVNHWLAALLGDPAAIRVRLTSDALAPGAALPEVSVAQLGLQPLDLVALLADGFDAAVGTLAARVLDQLRPTDLPPDQAGVVTADGPQTTATDAWRIETVRAPAWGPAIRSITDVAPLLEAAVDLLGASKPAVAADLAAPEFTDTAGDGIDAEDLATRGQRLLDGARADAVALARLLAEDEALDDAVLDEDPAAWLAALRVPVPADPSAEHPSSWLPRLDLTTGTAAEQAARLARLDAFWALRDAWREAALAAQAHGVRIGLPRRFLSRTQVSTELLQSAEAAFLDLAARCRTASATLDAAAVPAPASAWLQVAKDLLGEAALLVPRIGLDPVRADLQTALDAQLVPPDDLDAWLEGAAAVRPGAADLAELQLLVEAAGGASTPGAVAQLPHKGGEPWLGGALADPTAHTGAASIVLFGAAHLPAAGATGSALLLDEWSESVPYREEITGVALHYDQPDATAPQAVLVAVPPVLDQPWTLEALAATLHDTLELARNRTVELEHIGASRYGQLLPLVVGEVVPHAADGPVAGDRVILDFHQNDPGPADGPA
ncbi:hypothetical protein [Demequina subtropica]|uniref:hypothetical protein n=1 Tax=Demequina subtropica TaxID=1638989 RepID=UPI0007856A95|nr:hypothetical protein [Demequina subtropica]